MSDFLEEEVPPVSPLSTVAVCELGRCVLDQLDPDVLRRPQPLNVRRLVDERLPRFGIHFCPASREELGNKEGATDPRGDGEINILSSARLDDHQQLLVIREITTEREQERRLVQQERLAVVGELAGGVAHDFNNMLAVILSYAGFVSETLPPGSPLAEDLEQIRLAAQRAVSLTRQLLAFSRREVIAPTVLDLNEIISSMVKMLGRTIGEHVALAVDLDPALGRVKADRGQLEQVIVNLAVNARDAMPKGGTLRITTRHAVPDPRRAQLNSIAAAPHVLLNVTDMGCGMTEEVAARIFEPFFTTKGVGRGTGLGLSTVYGIVKQAGGGIWVTTKVGEGTTFEVYLPLTAEAAETAIAITAASPVDGGQTVLVVEDEEAVRAAAVRVLRQAGYTVLQAANGAEGLEVARHHAGDLDLVLSDVVMPQMSGPDLVTALAAIRPQTRVLLMSGHHEERFAPGGALPADVPLLQKPFDREALLGQVRRVLAEQRRPVGETS